MKIKFESQKQKGWNITGGVMNPGEILTKHSGTIVFEECTEEQLEKLKKHQVGNLLKIEECRDKEFKIIKAGVLRGKNSIEFEIESEKKF